MTSSKLDNLQRLCLQMRSHAWVLGVRASTRGFGRCSLTPNTGPAQADGTGVKTENGGGRSSPSAVPASRGTGRGAELTTCRCVTSHSQVSIWKQRILLIVQFPRVWHLGPAPGVPAAQVPQEAAVALSAGLWPHPKALRGVRTLPLPASPARLLAGLGSLPCGVPPGGATTWQLASLRMNDETETETESVRSRDRSHSLFIT